MQPRRQARILATQALFEIDMTGHDAHQVIMHRLVDSPIAETGITFAREMVFGVAKNKARIDQIIVEIAPEWPIDQVAIIDRNILRLAIYEMMETDTPAKVVINEAVELAKTFGSDSSHRFINGVLGTLVRNRGKYSLTKVGE